MKKTRTFRFSALLLAGVLAASPCSMRSALALGGSKTGTDNKAAEDAAKQVNADFEREFKDAKTPEERRAILDKWSNWRADTGGLAGGVDQVTKGGGASTGSSGYGYGMGGGMGDYFKFMLMMQLASTAAGIVGQLINQAVQSLMKPKDPNSAANDAKKLAALEHEKDAYDTMSAKAAADAAKSSTSGAEQPTSPGSTAGPVAGPTLPTIGGSEPSVPSSGGSSVGHGTMFDSPIGGSPSGGGGGSYVSGGGGYGGVPGNPFGGGDPKGDPKAPGGGVSGDSKPGDTKPTDGKTGASNGAEVAANEEVVRKVETVSGRLVILPRTKPVANPESSGGDETPAAPAQPSQPTPPAPGTGQPAAPAPGQPAQPGMDPADGPDPADPVDEPSGKIKGAIVGAKVKRRAPKADEAATKGAKLKGLKSKKTPAELVDALVKVEMKIAEWKKQEKAKAIGEVEEPAVEGAAKPTAATDGLDGVRGPDGRIDLSKVDVWLVSDWKKETPRRFRVTFDPDAAAQLTNPTPGAPVVVRGGVAKLDIDKQILDELRGEVNEIEITQIMLAGASKPADPAQPGNDGQ